MDKPIEGFTLIEVMVVLLVMAILLGAGMPSFLNLIEKMSTESEAKTLVEGLRTARVVAAEQRKRIVVCPSANGTRCGGNADWNTGFLVFRDDNSENDERDTNEEILFQHNFRESVQVRVPSGINRKFYFNEVGWTVGTADSVLICANEGTNVNGFRIVINRAGRLRIEDSTVTWRNSNGDVLNC